MLHQSGDSLLSSSLQFGFSEAGHRMCGSQDTPLPALPTMKPTPGSGYFLPGPSHPTIYLAPASQEEKRRKTSRQRQLCTAVAGGGCQRGKNSNHEVWKGLWQDPTQPWWSPSPLFRWTNFKSRYRDTWEQKETLLLLSTIPGVRAHTHKGLWLISPRVYWLQQPQTHYKLKGAPRQQPWQGCDLTKSCDFQCWLSPRSHNCC